MQIKINLDPVLFRELETASTENKLSPQTFAAECVESVLASRRLPRVQASSAVPRMSGTVETTMLDAPRRAECRADFEPPLLADLDGLPDIT